MSQYFENLWSNLDREVEGTTFGDGICGTLDFLGYLAHAEGYAPDLINELRHFVDDACERGQAEFDCQQAMRYRDSGAFDDAGSAYFYLYFRTARKGYGIDRAIRMAEFAMDGAPDHIVAALRDAISAMCEESGSEDIQAQGNCRAARHAAGVQDLMAAAFAGRSASTPAA